MLEIRHRVVNLQNNGTITFLYVLASKITTIVPYRFWRNIIHVALLTMAVGAVGGAIIGSLDSCNSTLENVTVTRNIQRQVTVSVNVTQNVTLYQNVTQNVTVEVRTPLSAYILLDASFSMAWAESGKSACPSGVSCNSDYVIDDADAQGNSDNTTQFSCFNFNEVPCWPTPSSVTIDSHAYDVNAEGDRK